MTFGQDAMHYSSSDETDEEEQKLNMEIGQRLPLLEISKIQLLQKKIKEILKKSEVPEKAPAPQQSPHKSSFNSTDIRAILAGMADTNPFDNLIFMEQADLSDDPKAPLATSVDSKQSQFLAPLSDDSADEADIDSNASNSEKENDTDDARRSEWTTVRHHR